MSTDPTLPPAGWYPDPAGTPRRRYWDGRAWTEFFDGGAAAGTLEQRALPEGTRVDTPYIWLIVLLPLLSTIAILFWDFDGYLRQAAADPRGLSRAPDPGYLLVTAVGWLSYAATVVLAVLDWRALKRMGIERPFHWAWSFISIVYIIGRSVVVHRRVGRGLAPLWTFIAVYLVSLIVIGVKLVGAVAGFASTYSGTPGT